MRRRLALILGVALVVVASLGAGGIANAMWSASATASASASSGAVAASVSGFGQLNGAVLTSSANTAGPVAVTFSNTGTLPLTGFAVHVTSTGSTSLAHSTTLQVWDNGQSTLCGSGPGSAASWSGRLDAAIAWPAPAAAIPATAGEHENYCVTLTMSPVPAGLSITPTLTVTGEDGAWLAPTSAAAAFTLTTKAADPRDVTPSQIGISPANTDTSIGRITLPVYGTTGDENENPDGTMITPSWACVYVPVATTGPTWKVAVNMSVPPFNGAPLTNAALDISGTQTGTLVSTLPDANGVYYVQGPSSRTSFSFCVEGKAPKVMSPGPGTYTVSPVTVGSCSDASRLPTVTTDVCLYASVTGAYPHFEIGYTVSADLAALSRTSGLNSAVSGYLAKLPGTLGADGIRWSTVSSSPGGVYLSGSATKTKSGSVYTISSTGIEATSGGIAAGQFVNLKWEVGN
jgi:hypothetical protein